MGNYQVPYAPQGNTFQPNYRLVELLRDQGSDQAQFALQHGAIEAQLAQTLGRIPGQAVQTYQEVQKAQLGNIALTRAKREDDAQAAFVKRLKSTPPIPIEAGGPFDVASIVKGVTDDGFDPTVIGDHLEKLNGSFQQAQAAKLALIKQGAGSIAAAGNDPGLAGHFLDVLEQTQMYPPATIAQFRGIAQTPEGVGKLTTYLMGPQKPEILKEGEKGFSPITHQPIPGLEVAPKLNEWDLAMKASGGDPLKAVKLVHPDRVPTEAGLAIASVQDAKHPDGTPFTDAEKSALAMTKLRPFVAGAPGSSEDVVARALAIGKEKNGGQPLTDQQVQDITLKAREQYTAAGRAEPDVAPVLTPDALKLTAHQFAMTGQLPPMGMGKAGATVRTAIINQAAEEYKGLDLPSQVAAYKANQSSLTKLQGTADKVAAFESTAGKNLDQFLTLAGKVPDTGIPWLNSPIRTLNANVVGSTNQAAFNAARDVALREIARVTSDPNLSGVLSDSARKEVQALSPESATFAQIKHVATVLKQDMANVKSSLNEQIGSIQQRIATPPGEKPAAATFDASKGGTPNVGDTLQKFGATYKWDGTGWQKQ